MTSTVRWGRFGRTNGATSWRRAALAASVGLGLAACASASDTPAAGDRVGHADEAVGILLPGKDIWLTTGAQPGPKLQAMGAITWTRLRPAAPTIAIDTTTKFQVMSGFGAALNDASAFNIGRLPPADSQALLSDLFSRTAGIGLSYVRLTLGASDFSLSDYTYDDTAPDLSDFSLAKAQTYVIPLARAAKALNPELRFMGSPWSAPAWMKENGHLTCSSTACKVMPGSYDIYADYLRKTVDAYAANGVPLDTLTIQNEPHNPASSYPGTYYDWWDELNFVRVLGPKLAGTGVRLLSWDHNWYDSVAAGNAADPNDPNGNFGWYPKLAMGDPNGTQYYAGSAWHNYQGLPTTMTSVHDALPNKGVYFTEFNSSFTDSFAQNLGWVASANIIPAVQNWAKTALFWNMALDAGGGPHTGGCDYPNCAGVLTVGWDGLPTEKRATYYALGHFSKFVRPGAWRVSSSTLMKVPGVQHVAFQNPDCSIAVVLYNANATTQTLGVQRGAMFFSYAVPGQSLMTFTWANSETCSAPPNDPK